MIKLGGLIDLRPQWLNEAEDDKYVSIGFGRYKQKGKEDDENAPTFKKDDSGKYVPTGDKAAKGGDSSAEKDTPKVNIFDKPKKDKEAPKKDKKSDAPKLSIDTDDMGDYEGMSFDTGMEVEKYLNKELGLDGSMDINANGAIEYNIPDSTDTLQIGNDEISGKPFSVALANEDGFDPGDTYKAFDNDADAMAYAKELAQKLKGGAEDTPKSEPKSDSSEKAPRDDKNRIIVPKELELKGDRFNDDWYQQKFAWIKTKEEQDFVTDLIKKSSPQVVNKLSRDPEKLRAAIQKQIDKKKDEPKDSANSRPGNPQVNKVVRKKAESLGITPQKLGKEEYESRMSKAAVEALTDANFHSEARKLIAVLEDKPEWADDPRQDPNMPDIMSPEYEKWQKTSVYSSTFYDSAEGTDELAHAATGESGWDGVAALDAIAFDLKMNGSKKLAAKLQGIIDDTNESTIRLTKMEWKK